MSVTVVHESFTDFHDLGIDCTAMFLLKILCGAIFALILVHVVSNASCNGQVSVVTVVNVVCMR